MGRPRAYATPEARQIARREQNRKNIAALRERRRAADAAELALRPQPPSNSVSFSTVNEYDKQKRAHQEAIEQRKRQVVDYLRIVDFESVSRSAPIDLSFSTIQSVVLDFERLTGLNRWMQGIRDLGTPDRLVEIATFAAGSRYVGFVRQDNRMIHLSRLCYAKALERLRSVLQRPIDRNCLAPSVANDALLIYETLEGSLPERTAFLNWKSHFDGGIAIVEAAGPKCYASSLGRAVLKSIRFRMIYISIINRQKNLFDSPAWRNDLYVDTKPTQKEALWQLVEQVPALLRREDLIPDLTKIEPQLVEESASRLLDEADDLDWGLNNWYEGFIVGPEGHPLRERPSQGFPSAEFDLFPTVFEFEDNEVASCFTYYWMAKLLVENIRESMIRFLGRQPKASSAYEYATNICRSMSSVFGVGTGKYDLRGIMGAAGITLWASTRYFAANETTCRKELGFCQLVQEMASQRGFRGTWTKMIGQGLGTGENDECRVMLARSG